MVAALACFHNSISLVTVYASLGEDGVAHAIGQTKAKTAITSQDLIPKLSRIIHKVSHLKTIVYFESRSGEKLHQLLAGVRLVPFSKLSNSSKKAKELTAPQPDDLAIIMYTSGSSGTPKGTLLTHGHIAKAISASLAFGYNMMGVARDEAREAYLAYLPLAHVFELSLEMIVLMLGVKVGYSGPNTLLDTSTMIKSGQKGDAVVLRPNIMVAVPVVLDRMYKAINAKIKARGIVFETVFDMLYRYCVFWRRCGYDTPVLNRVLFGRFREIVGGNLKTIVSGGAPLMPEVHEFMRTCLCLRLPQGYGLTETTGGVTMSDYYDISTGGIGSPLPEVLIKLQNWPEGGYTVNDPQGPRGEIVIGCPWIASGYLDLPEATEESFYEEDGVRWFVTGDVGQMMPDGTIRLVDRRKDLVKLQMGEYVSLGKVEAKMKVHPLVEHVCVVADPTKDFTVALMVPDDLRLKEAAVEVFGEDNGMTREDLCAHPDMTRHVLASLQSHLRQLEKFEIPRKLALIPEVWLPDSGLVTAALKLRRNVILKHYRMKIEMLYSVQD